MMLRSASTPVLGSLLASTFSESPNTNFHQFELHPTTKHTTSHQNCSLISCINGGSQTFSRSTLHSPSITELKIPFISSKNGFRRVQSEGNLEELVNDDDELSFSNPCFKKFARKPNCCTLEAIPSISFHKMGSRYESEDSDDEDFEHEEEKLNPFRVENLFFDEKSIDVNDHGSLRFESDQGKMYIAAGLGVSGIGFLDGGGSGGSGSFRPVDFNRDSGENRGDVGMEEHYKNMLEENPGNSLVLRNYAQFLYQKKGDLRGADEYYCRAILADPEDGEVLSQYAQLIWEFHHDKERATDYFERAVQASSQDSHIQAAYANFLWDIEDEDEDDDNHSVGPLIFRQGAVMASANA